MKINNRQNFTSHDFAIIQGVWKPPFDLIKRMSKCFLVELPIQDFVDNIDQSHEYEDILVHSGYTLKLYYYQCSFNSIEARADNTFPKPEHMKSTDDYVVRISVRIHFEDKKKGFGLVRLFMPTPSGLRPVDWTYNSPKKMRAAMAGQTDILDTEGDE